MALTASQTKQLLAQLGHRPKKSFGQNFLIDPNIVRKQLKLALLKEGEPIVEIGPGLGTLTESLLETGAFVYAIELDTRLAQHLREHLLARYPKRLNLMLGDAVEHPLAGLFNGQKSPLSSFHIIANLPYAISTPWMANLLKIATLPQSMVLMLQKEAAERFSAACNTKAFGPISIALQAAFDINGLHGVPRQVFYPIPDVDSCLLVLEQKKRAHAFSPEGLKLIQRFFTQRRKQMARLIRNEKEADKPLQKWVAHLEAKGIPLNNRPENIEIEDWITLDDIMSQTLKSSAQ